MHDPLTEPRTLYQTVQTPKTFDPIHTGEAGQALTADAALGHAPRVAWRCGDVAEYNHRADGDGTAASLLAECKISP